LQHQQHKVKVSQESINRYEWLEDKSTAMQEWRQEWHQCWLEHLQEKKPEEISTHSV